MFKRLFTFRANATRLLTILIVLAFGLIPTLWFKSGYALSTEEGYFLNYYNISKKHGFAWANSEFGFKSNYVLLYFPVYLIWNFFNLLHINLYLQPLLFFILIWLGASFFLYKIIELKTNRQSVFWVFVAAASFYFLNFDSLYNRGFYSFKSLPFVIIPCLYYFSKKYFLSAKIIYLYIILFVNIITQSLVLDPASFLITYSILFIGLFENFIAKKKIDIKYLLFAFFLIVFTLTKFYFLTTHQDYYTKIIMLNKGTSEGVSLQLSNRFKDIVSFSPSWWKYPEMGADYYFGIYPFYNNPEVKIISYFPFLFLIFLHLLASTLVKEKEDTKRQNLFYLLLIIILLFLIKGLSPPFSVVNTKIFNFSSYVYIFRDLRKFYYVVVFLVFLAFLNLIPNLLRRYEKLGRCMIVLLVAANIYFALPVLQGKILDPRNSFEKNKFIDMKIPDYWFRASRFVNEYPGDCKVLFLPGTESHAYWYYWYDTPEGNAYVNLPMYMVNKSVITGCSYHLKDPYLFAFYKQIYQNPGRMLPHSNICLVVNQRDATPATLIKEADNFYEYLIPIKTEGLLDIYKVKEEYYRPNIYAPESLYLLNTNMNSLLGQKDEIVKNGSFLLSEPTFQKDNISEISIFANKKLKPPEINFQKINNTKYLVQVRNAGQSFVLQLSNMFNRGWKVYVKQDSTNPLFTRTLFENWGKKSVTEDKHFEINGYANAWYISPEEVDNRKDYDLAVEFLPQRYFYYGILSDSILLVGGLILLFVKKTLSSKRK